MARRITIIIDDEIHDRFRKYCTEKETSMQAIIENHIREIIRPNESDEPLKITITEDPDYELADEIDGNDY